MKKKKKIKIRKIRVSLKRIPFTDYNIVHSCKKPCGSEKRSIGDCTCHNINWAKGENLSSRVAPFIEKIIVA